MDIITVIAAMVGSALTLAGMLIAAKVKNQRLDAVIKDIMADLPHNFARVRHLIDEASQVLREVLPLIEELEDFHVNRALTTRVVHMGPTGVTGPKVPMGPTGVTGPATSLETGTKVVAPE